MSPIIHMEEAANKPVLMIFSKSAGHYFCLCIAQCVNAYLYLLQQFWHQTNVLYFEIWPCEYDFSRRSNVDPLIQISLNAIYCCFCFLLEQHWVLLFCVLPMLIRFLTPEKCLNCPKSFHKIFEYPKGSAKLYHKQLTSPVFIQDLLVS